VRITGHPNVLLTLECEDALGNHAGGGNATAAGRIVNAIPVLRRLPAGLVGGAELPLIAGRGLLV
jgi:hypothetical protein